ncbi:ABC-type multidrug transport system fused ATPase/permease subunit [Saccharothrix tamanrassetensis]|uniref:ABC-type multidrug transport system fused ATPase/permease subunit n=1 Tax=Saccharothrix tamanrassetensis TaxID=1051531 RepID=A0A841CTH9_9PSEU|nr:ABC-type multidrug transport system fused ATPase/permease subunit [Saccharothrix tamanrassetensis]
MLGRLPRAASSMPVLRDRLANRRGAVAVVLVLELGARGVGLVQPLAARHVVDGVGSARNLTGPIAVLGALAVVGLLFNYVAYRQRGKLSERFVLDLRKEAARRTIFAPVPVVESRSAGDILSRIGSDTTLVQHTVVKALVDLVVVPLTVVAGIVLMLFVDLSLAALVVGLLALAAVVELKVFGRLVRNTERGQQHVGAMTGVVHRLLPALRTVKASSMEHREAESFDREAGSAYRAGLRAAKTGALADTVAYASVDLTFLTVLAVGVLEVSAGTVGVGDLVAILLYVVYIQDPVESLTESASRFSEGLAALRRITELLELRPETEALPPRAHVTGRPRKDGCAPGRYLRLDQVSFSYEGREVLRDVTIEARPGLTVLVGSSGAGKTTILSLVERFVEPDRGRVLLDGVDVREFPLPDLRRRVSYVEQEAPLLGDTIREAATYGIDGLDDGELQRVLASVGLDA